MGYLEEILAAVDNAKRVAKRNWADSERNPAAYAEKMVDVLRNRNAGVVPVATSTELTKRPLTMEERVNDTLNSVDFGGGMGVIKPKGGNWLSGPYGPEAALKSLKKAGVAEDNLAAQGIITGPKAVDNWIDNQLTKYVKNDMAAPTDPIRKLADAWPEEKAAKLAVAEARVQKLRQKQQAQAATRGVPEAYLTQTRQDILAAEEARDLIDANTGLHIPDREVLPGTESYLMGKRAAEGFPVNGMATTSLGRQWETQADSEFNPRPVKDFLLTENLKQDPWLAKADPNAKVNTMMYGAGDFGHITDELANSLREGRLTPEQLSKMPIDQAVRHVAEINALRKVTAAKQQAQDASEIPVFKDYPEQGMSWRQLKAPEVTPELAAKLEQESPEVAAKRKLQKWLTQEGDAMGHCVGQYCDDVASGHSNIYSLRDAKGKPHVTIETNPGLIDMADYSENKIQGMMNQEDAIAAIRQLEKQHPDTHGDLTHWIARLKFSGSGVPRIAQIKGPSNRAPAEEHLPFIQDFIKQGKWGAINDLHNSRMDILQANSYLVPRRM